MCSSDLLVGDLVPGLMAALGLVSAVLPARSTGEGQFLDVAMFDAVMALGEPAQSTWDYLGRDYPPQGNAIDDVTPFDVYATADGHCAIAAPSEHLWALLCEAMGRPDLVAAPETATNTVRVAGRPFDPVADEGPRVCACFGVTRDAIRHAIVTKRLTSPHEIGEALRAGTNCGSCVPEIEGILRDVRVPA